MDKPFAGPQELQSFSFGYARMDLIALVLTAPLLLAPGLFPLPLSGLALALLIAPYVVRLALERPPARPTAANFPVALLALVFLPLAFLMTPASWTVTWERVTTLAWSIALFFCIANWPQPGRQARFRTRINGPTRIYLALGGVAAVLGLLGMRSVDKLFSLSPAGLLADYMGWENGLATNEIAGVLTLFLPFAAALTVGCLMTQRRRQTLILLPLTLFMAVTLVLSQSRTGLVAAAVGVALVPAVSGLPSRRWVAAGLIAAGLAAVLIGLTPVADWFVFAGANSWDSVLGPRLGIWQQAADAIRDHPVWGMGLGVFGGLARFVYPLTAPENGPVLEDAHNLYLQTALDFGVAGLIVFLVLALIIFISAVRLVRDRPPRTLGRLWATGLLGALVAHALYSITDAVALGTLAGVPLWFLFGLVMGATGRRLQPVWSTPARLLFVGALLLVTVLSAFSLRANRAGQLAAYALMNPTTNVARLATDIGRLAAGDCRARWYEGLLYHTLGNTPAREAAWSALLDCSNEYVGYMSTLAPDDATLAGRAVALRPENAAGYFWLASIVAAEAPGDAVSLYRQGLGLAPADGRHWLALGDLLQASDPSAAREAYLQACLNGDPGANGCLRAGGIAERQGDPRLAIGYYRLSHLDGALEKAAELERQLGQ